MQNLLASIVEALPGESADNILVQQTAAAMRDKLEQKRRDGRGGWLGTDCSSETLHNMLIEHCGKGDMIDVVNLAAMIHVRGQLYGEKPPRGVNISAPPPTCGRQILNPADMPRIYLDARGNSVAAGSNEHVATHFITAGLVFDVRPWQQVNSLAEARAVAAECDLLDCKGDWVIGEDYETQLIIDRRFHEPAVDKKSFPNAPSSGLVYTNRSSAWSRGRVWFVGLGYGGVDWDDGGSVGLAVPVLRVPPSQ